MNALFQPTLLLVIASFGYFTVGSYPAIAKPVENSTEPIWAEMSRQAKQHPDRFPLVLHLSEVSPSDETCQGYLASLDRDQVINSHEFAAGINPASEPFHTNINIELLKCASKAELEVIQRMQDHFAQTLAAVTSGQLSSNDRLVQTLGQSFSLTSKLNGEAIIQASFIGGRERADNRQQGLDRQLTLSQRSKVEITTSFTGKDLLTTSLRASNLPNLARASGTDMLRLAVQGDTNNQLEADEISYRFPIGKPITARVIVSGGSFTDFVKSLNPFLGDSGDGGISRFAQRNPILRQGGGVGAGLSYKFNDQILLGIGYIGDDLDDPTIGLNNAGYGAIAQLTFSPTDSFDLGIAYIRSYNTLSTGTGSSRANDPFAGSSNAIVGNTLGLQTSLGVNSSVHLSAWLGWTQAHARDLNNDPKADIFNWAVTLALPNVGSTGNLLGFAIGQPPKVIRNEFTHGGQTNTDRDTSLHLEGFYRWRLNDNIAFTAGVIIVTSPEHDRQNSTLYSGVLRSTLSF